MKLTTNEHQYKSNIIKSHMYRFLHNFMFLSGVLIPFFTVWGGISFFQIMILQAFFTFSSFLLEIPTGAIADRWGRKTSLVLAGFITAIAAFVYSSYPNFWVFMAGEFLWATGAALISGADQAMLYDSLRELKKEKNSKQIFGRWESIGMIALMVSAPIGSFIAKYIGLRETMMFMAAPMILVGLVALTFKEPEIGRRKEKTEYFKILKKGIKYFHNHKILKVMAVDYVSIGTLAFFIVWVYQVVLMSLNIDIVYFGFVHAGLTLAEVLVLNMFIPLEKLFGGKKRYIFISGLLAGAGFILIALTKNIYLVLTGIIVVSAFGLTRRILFQNYMNKFIKSENRATVLSTIAMIYSFSMAVSNLILGKLVDWNLTVALLITGSLIILFALMSKVEEEHLLD